jgi:hypothetical protein
MNENKIDWSTCKPGDKFFLGPDDNDLTIRGAEFLGPNPDPNGNSKYPYLARVWIRNMYGRMETGEVVLHSDGFPQHWRRA